LTRETILDEIERSPKLIKECKQIRARMTSGQQFLSHEQVKKRLGA
jgi:hypothetical protein